MSFVDGIAENESRLFYSLQSVSMSAVALGCLLDKVRPSGSSFGVISSSKSIRIRALFGLSLSLSLSTTHSLTLFT